MSQPDAREPLAATHREKALALLDACGPQADALLLALTHAVLALSEPPRLICTCQSTPGDSPICVYHGRKAS